jgi:pSer/pThr/pTyr-binding forkhead associated (FHA) protein
MPYIEIISSPANLKTNRIPLQEGANVLGREKGCDIEITDPRISSKHAIIMVQGQEVEILDQNSTNGIYLNDQRVRKAKWADGATVFIGNTELRLKTGAAAASGLETGTSAWGQKETSLRGPALGGTRLVGRPKTLKNSNFYFKMVV